MVPMSGSMTLSETRTLTASSRKSREWGGKRAGTKPILETPTTATGCSTNSSKHMGRSTSLVNNAVASADPHFVNITEEFWDFLVGHALKGYLFCSQRAVKEMIKQGSGGRVVSISSVHSYRAWPQDTVYGMVKVGLNRMAMSMALDLAGTGITSNCVAPGYIDSRVLPPEEEHTRGKLEGYVDYARDYIPNQRGGVPRDIANACLFLASDLGDYVNGQTITVDGGFLAGGVPPEAVPLEPGMPGAIE